MKIKISFTSSDGNITPSQIWCNFLDDSRVRYHEWAPWPMIEKDLALCGAIYKNPGELHFKNDSDATWFLLKWS